MSMTSASMRRNMRCDVFVNRSDMLARLVTGTVSRGFKVGIM